MRNSTGVLAIPLVLISCSPAYRSQDAAACEERGVAYVNRIEKLRQDARQTLVVGSKKDVVIKFFARNGMDVAFVAGEATGHISTTGCAPVPCGSDAAVIVLRVNVDSSGTVKAEPVVIARYINCL